MPDETVRGRLEEIATNIFPGLVEYIGEFSETIVKGIMYEDIKKDDITRNKLNIYYETYYINIHIIDRILFEIIGPLKRDVVIDKILILFSEGVKNIGHNVEHIRHEYNRYQIEYSSYKEIYSKPDGVRKGSLCWEFGKMIAFKYANKNPMTIMFLETMTSERYVGLKKILCDPRIGLVK